MLVAVLSLTEKNAFKDIFCVKKKSFTLNIEKKTSCKRVFLELQPQNISLAI